MKRKAPPKIPNRLARAPALSEIYWCDFPQDAQAPELWKTRPVIVVSKERSLHGTVTVIPCSKSPRNATNKWALEVGAKSFRDRTWAICDKPTSVAVSRLSQIDGSTESLGRLDFQKVVNKMLSRLASFR